MIPLVSFAIGIVAAEIIRTKFQRVQQIHWRQLVLIIEIFLLLFVGFIPENLNMLANAVVSFSCAMQVQTFRKVNGYAFASTMCIGNIRSGMESLCVFGRTRDKHILFKSLCYFAIIVMFAFGAGLGSGLISTFEGFQMNADEVTKVVDVVNEVANTEPIDTAGIFDGLTRSASSMKAANNTFEETVALITAANSVVQDPDSVGMWLCRH